MSAATIYSLEFRRMSVKRYVVYIIISASAAACYHIVSTTTLMLISASSALPLLLGYTAHEIFDSQLQYRQSLRYCVLLSAVLLSLGDAAHFIQAYFVADPDLMASAHLAVTHFCLAFLVLSETEYHSQIGNPMPYPDIFLAPAANMFVSLYPNSSVYRCFSMSDAQEPPAAVLWRAATLAATLDVAICVLWYVGVWRFTSLLQERLNTDFQPAAGVMYRPFTTAYGFEVVWTSKGLNGCMLQVVMMRPVRILNSYIFACGADGVGWLRQLQGSTKLSEI